MQNSFESMDTADVSRAQLSGVDGYRADSDDVLVSEELYEAMVNPHGTRRGKSAGAGGGSGMMPPMMMGRTGATTGTGAAGGSMSNMSAANMASGIPGAQSTLAGMAGKNVGTPTLGIGGGVGSSFGAGYGSGVTAGPIAANSTFRGGVDLDNDGIPDTGFPIMQFDGSWPDGINPSDPQYAHLFSTDPSDPNRLVFDWDRFRQEYPNYGFDQYGTPQFSSPLSASIDSGYDFDSSQDWLGGQQDRLEEQTRKAEQEQLELQRQAELEAQEQARRTAEEQRRQQELRDQQLLAQQDSLPGAGTSPAFSGIGGGADLGAGGPSGGGSGYGSSPTSSSSGADVEVAPTDLSDASSRWMTLSEDMEGISATGKYLEPEWGLFDDLQGPLSSLHEALTYWAAGGGAAFNEIGTTLTSNAESYAEIEQDNTDRSATIVP